MGVRVAGQSGSRGKYWCVVRVDFSEPGLEEAFNEWYTNVHVRELLERPGIYRAWRLRVEPEGPSIGEPGPRYLAVYEIEHPSAFDSEAFRRLPKWDGVWQQYIRNWSRTFYRVLVDAEREPRE